MILSQNIRILTKKGKKLAKFGKNLAKFGKIWKNSHSKHGQLWYCLKTSEFWQNLAKIWKKFGKIWKNLEKIAILNVKSNSKNLLCSKVFHFRP